MTYLISLSPDQAMSIAMWVIGGFLGLLLMIVVHIGNAGSSMKKQLSNHGERITRVETGMSNLNETAHRVEDKLDRLIERR